MKRIIILTIPILLLSCNSNTDKRNSHSTIDPELQEYDESPEQREKSEPLTVETINGSMIFDDLKEKSSSFIRYSRNQYFAKKGYKFADENLQLFFEHQDWYEQANSNRITLENGQTTLVDSMKSIEDNYGSVEYMKIIHKFLYEEHPLFYIGWDPQTINDEPNEFFEGGFALLEPTMVWTLECESIPPEYLITNSLKFIELIDDSRYLRKSQIEFHNLDSGCIGGEKNEIIIHLEGPSDDYNDIVLGFDKKGFFNVLFDEFVTIDKINKLTESTLELITTKRCDFIGTMFCEKKYIYLTITKEIVDVPYEFDKVGLITRNTEEVSLYTSSLAARREMQDSIVGKILPDTKVELIRYLNKSNSYKIITEDLTGWIDYEHLKKFEILYAD